MIRFVSLTGFAWVLALRVDHEALISLVYEEELIISILVECVDFEGVCHFVSVGVLQSHYFQSDLAILVRNIFVILNHVEDDKRTRRLIISLGYLICQQFSVDRDDDSLILLCPVCMHGRYLRWIHY